MKCKFCFNNSMRYHANHNTGKLEHLCDYLPFVQNLNVSHQIREHTLGKLQMVNSKRRK
jgi:hypothetical protein